jgi:two-component system, OmpR family, response regulator VanR
MDNNLMILKHLSVLVVEDDVPILIELEKTLQIFFNVVYTAQNGHDAYLIYQRKKPDMVITDIKMPLLNGIDFIKKIREEDYDTSIVLMSAYSEQETLLKALNLGVDGYIIKPVELEELLNNCLKNLKRQKNNTFFEKVSFKNGLMYHNLTKELTHNGKAIELGIKELRLLELFLENREKTMSKEYIVSTLWPLDEITDSALKSVLSRLRKKIGEEHIINVKGYGWKFTLGH